MGQRIRGRRWEKWSVQSRVRNSKEGQEDPPSPATENFRANSVPLWPFFLKRGKRCFYFVYYYNRVKYSVLLLSSNLDFFLFERAKFKFKHSLSIGIACSLHSISYQFTKASIISYKTYLHIFS